SDPRLDGEIVGQGEVRAIRHPHIVATALEVERLSDLAGGEGRAVLEGAVVDSGGVVGVALGPVPTLRVREYPGAGGGQADDVPLHDVTRGRTAANRNAV